MTLIEQLETLGFKSNWDGMTYEVPGQFGVEVVVRLNGWDGEPLADPKVSMRLPHQCDSWEIVEAETDYAKAQLDSMMFYNEISLARAALDSALIKIVAAQR